MSFKPLFDSTQTKLRDGTATNPIHVKVRSENQGGFRSCVKIRDFTLTIDQPKGFGGTNTGPKPSEVLLAALAACQEITWRLYADALGVPLVSVAVELDGLQDLRGFLGLSTEVKPGYDELRYTVHIKGNGSPEQFEKIHRAVMATSPNYFNLRNAIPLKSRLMVS